MKTDGAEWVLQRDLLISFMPAKRQNLMFSATCVLRISWYFTQSSEVETAPKIQLLKKLSHKVYNVDKTKNSFIN
jgi:ATP-dependent RNA helicase RhlE